MYPRVNRAGSYNNNQFFIAYLNDKVHRNRQIDE